MPDLTTDELTTLARYFAGQCSAADADAVARWIEADPTRHAHVERLRAEWAASGFLLEAERVDALWRRVERRLPTPVPTRAPTAARVTLAPPRPGYTAAVWRIAAGIALVAGVAGLWWSVGDRWTARSGSVATVSAERVVATARGQRARYRLPDGTDVLLGPASTMRYVIAANHGPRTVSLEGSAYFVVTHNAERPFVVRTAHGTAKDLGTRFAVQAYAADSVIDVVVAEGKVSLSAVHDTNAVAPDSVVLAPGDRGRANAEGRMTAERGVAVNRYLAWTEGQLEFEDTPLADALAQISRWYDVDVRLADPILGQKQLTASFRNEPVAEVLGLIEASAGVRVERQGKLVTFHAR